MNPDCKTWRNGYRTLCDRGIKVVRNWPKRETHVPSEAIMEMIKFTRKRSEMPTATEPDESSDIVY